MTNVVEFPDPNKPSPEFVTTDAFGRPMYRYCGSYQYDGKTWAIDTWGYDMEDAAARFEAMRATAQLDGQLMEAIPE